MGRIVRVEFVLSMPTRSSWNGQWSGAGKHYSIIRIMPAPTADALLAGGGQWAWRFTDGWCAMVVARAIHGRAPNSDGFCGYDWMVRTICQYGRILDDAALKAHLKAETVRITSTSTATKDPQ